ncbi:MAG: cysteine desulfuration protein SufE [Pseudoalteromonas tetraodonis]|jgi:cysteine desulfuration protein SufE|uniref:Cysteine desulfurase, sulfur acceptor subunit CsdE n=3 Tax=Pseudoalteromonas TaxID=53246 RepID=A0AA37S492_9GAMM|nr:MULTISPECIES: SufE family protein [Pseudoalteromonas]MAY58168.1 SufE protein [Pseudoalteromonas sp.]ALQ54870.1 SufE protein [Pseudoalteromonas issachenkonii]ATC90692.1 cysteine desulfuration protein SufE [Pseudoalteromonas issachenkonii]ATD03270.1 cysteine desulfuration protein SufE [Pseudoalteromonas tetraodonis]KGK01355.1 Fe-S metabolism associated SufE [Pseudoalteromonas sp. ND6B]|tara:strand:- start:589 stop:1005 length:417 start_codon:yes stop_codon:yes gene_type:complete
MTHTYQLVTKSIQSSSSWQQKYREIMLLGKTLPPLADILKTDDALVPGCESKVWMFVEFDLTENALVVIGDSDTRIVKGLLALILALYNGLTPEEVLAVNAYDEFEKLGLISHLSASRGNGVKAMVETIQTMAKQKAL